MEIPWVWWFNVFPRRALHWTYWKWRILARSEHVYRCSFLLYCRVGRASNARLYLLLYDGDVPIDSNLLISYEIAPDEIHTIITFRFKPSSCSKTLLHFNYHHSATSRWVQFVTPFSCSRNRSLSPVSIPTQLLARLSTSSTRPPGHVAARAISSA